MLEARLRRGAARLLEISDRALLYQIEEYAIRDEVEASAPEARRSLAVRARPKAAQ